MKKAFFQLMICLFALAPTSAWGATDTRFFGRYCGDATVRPCRRVCLPPFGYPCVTRCRTVEIKNINVAVEHQQRSSGIGVIVGSGRAKVDDDDLKLGVSAVVVTAGSARGIVASNRFDAAGGTAELAADGVSLTLSSVISGQAFSIHVGKDRCGNAPPTAKITRPSNGALLEFNAPNLFQGTASDAEDSAFPAERMRFVSDRDGPLTGTVLSQPTSL